MKSTTKIMVVAIAVLMAVFMIVAPAAAGYNLDRLEVSPSGDLSPGDQVTVECDITLTASSGLTFIANHDLEAYTELEDPEWEYQKEVNGHGIWGVSGKKYLTFGGWDLSYPDSNTIEIHYRLAGEVPEVSTTSEKTIFRLRETDVNGNVITNGETLVERTVLKGSVTIAGSGDGQYYMGEEVTLSGTNTYSGIVYLYITGPYVVSADGVKLDDITTTCITGSAATFVQECVRTDNTWEYTWDTANSGLDAGTYTIYAAARPNKKNDLTGVPYDTVSVVIRQPFITATTSAQTVAKGDGFYITGTADGNPDTLALAIWVLGNNYYQRVTKSVEDDGSFSHEISSAVTANMTSGQYFIVVQHPMYNGQLDIIPNVVETHTFVRNIITGTNLFVITGTGSLQGSDAACALVQAINSPDIDDISDKLAVFIEEPWIQISPVGNKYVGDTFSITGTTNLAVDDELFIDVTSYSTQSGVSSGSVNVGKGDGYNSWSFIVNTTTWEPDEYIVTVGCSAEPDASANATFDVLVRKPIYPFYLTATTSAQTVAKGDKFSITGTAGGNPDALAIWILGRNYYNFLTESVEDDGSFSHEISSAVTANMTSGQYFIAVQHPMYNGQLDVLPIVVGTQTFVQNRISGTNLFIIDGTGKLQGSDAAEALVQAINSPDIDDIYSKFTVLIEEAWIQISSVGNKYVGDTFTITGTTNLAVDDELFIDVTSSSTQSSVGSGSVNVGKGDGYNSWSFIVDTTTWEPDEYIVTVGCLAEPDISANTRFDVLKSASYIEGSWIRINPIRSISPDEIFDITGTTNLDVGDELFIDVNSFSTQSSIASGFVNVETGESFHTWSFAVNTTNWGSDEYIVTAECLAEPDISANITFGILTSAPDIDWQKCLGGSRSDYSHSISQTSDGGYIVTGCTGSADCDVSGNHGEDDMWVLKLNSDGTPVWQTCLGGSNWDEGWSISQTSDGGYIITGSTDSTDGDVSGNHGSNDMWVVKLDSNGALAWQKCLGGSDDDYGKSISQTSDGGYIVTGSTQSIDGDVSGMHGERDLWVVKLDSDGNLMWQKCMGGSSRTDGESISQTSDGGYIVTGHTWSTNGDVYGNHGYSDMWVVKLDSNGNPAWQRCLGGSDDDYGYSISQTSDGGYIVTGYTCSTDGDVSGNHGASLWGDMWVVKLDSDGNPVWQTCLGGSDDDYGYSISQTSDGGYIVTGNTNSNNGDVSGNHGVSDMWVVKLYSDGNPAWQKCLGGRGNDVGQSISQTTDGGYIVTGHTYSTDGDVYGKHGKYDMWVVKLRGLGAPIANFTALPTTGHAYLTVQFTDTSIGSPETWSWSFGDGATSTTQNPSHTYTTTGIYDVSLTITNITCSDTETKSGYITVTPPPVQNTLIFNPATSKVRTGETTEFNVVLNTVQNGLSGYNVTVALTDSSVGEIVGISYPTWAGIPVNGSVPTDSVYIQAVDLTDSVKSGATNVTLCTLTVRSDAVGTTNLTISATKVDDDIGGRYAPAVVDAVLTVEKIRQFPNPAGGIFPAPTDPNGDGLYEDLDGNGFIGYNDVVIYYRNMNFIESAQPLTVFDYDGSGFIGFNDVVSLYRMV